MYVYGVFQTFLLLRSHAFSKKTAFAHPPCVFIKVGLSPHKKVCVSCLIERSLVMMKNAFYFILKSFSVLKIFKFLSRRFGHV